MTDCDLETSVPEWLIDHPEILPVLQELGIDYSCGGSHWNLLARRLA